METNQNSELRREVLLKNLSLNSKKMMASHKLNGMLNPTRIEAQARIIAELRGQLEEAPNCEDCDLTCTRGCMVRER